MVALRITLQRATSHDNADTAEKRLPASWWQVWVEMSAVARKWLRWWCPIIALLHIGRRKKKLLLFDAAVCLAISTVFSFCFYLPISFFFFDFSEFHV